LLKAQLNEVTELFRQTTDQLKTNERDVIDYYAADLADMAIYVINCWLMLKDANLAPTERKTDVARIYINEHLPKIHSASAAIYAADSTPLNTRDSILADAF